MLLVACLAAAFLTLIPAASQGDRSYRLNGPLPMTIGGDAVAPLLSPDGTRVVYRADPRREESFELFSAPIDGSVAPIRISGRIDPQGSVFGYRFSPDGRQVAYLADPGSGVVGIYRAPVDGSAAPILLFVPQVEGGSIGEFALTGTRVVFLSDSLVDERFLLLSAPLDGSAPAVVLNAGLAARGEVLEFAISPDESRVLYLGSHQNHGQYELYVAPIDGSQRAERLDDGSWSVRDFQISPDGQRVVYAYYTNAPEIRSRPIDRSSPSVRFPGNLYGSYRISHDSTHVLYTRNPNRQSLFRAPIDGSSAPIELTPLPADVGFFDISLDDSFAVFVEVGGSPRSLKRVPTDGSALPVRLSQPAPRGMDVQWCMLDATGNRVIYWGDLTVDGRVDLYCVAVFGSDPILLAEDVSSGIQIVGDYVVFLRPGEPGSVFGVPIDGSSAPIVLNDPLVPGGRVGYPLVSPAGPRVVYSADQDALDVFELFSAPLATGGSTQINAEFPGRFTVGSVVAFAQTERVAVYVADQEVDDLFELFGVSARGAGTPYRLSQGEVDRVKPRITPDDKRVLFLAGGELFSTRVDGSGTPVRLSGPLVPGGAVVEYAPSPDSQWVVYLADQRVDETFELFARPVDGRARPVRLNAPLVSGGDVTRFAISPDSTRVVYLADQELDTVFALFSTDGRNPPIPLIPQQTPASDVTEFRITPVGERVLALADLVVNETFMLFSVPIDGSAGPAPLSRPMVAGGDVEPDFVISADGEWAAYRADKEVNDVVELFGVRTSGQSAPSKLSAPGTKIDPGIEISPDSTRVVFQARGSGGVVLGSAVLGGTDVPVELHRQASLNRFPFEISPDGRRVVFAPASGLFQRRIDGSEPALSLSALPTPATRIQISPDSSFAVYQREFTTPSHPLWFVPLDGSSQPIQVSDPVPGGHVNGFALSPEATRVLYLADRDEVRAFELFATRLQKGPLPADR